MEKQAQEIGQFLYKRGREGKSGGGVRRKKTRGRERLTEKDRQRGLCNFSVTVILFFRHTNMSDCEEIPLIIKASKSSEETVTCYNFY